MNSGIRFISIIGAVLGVLLLPAPSPTPIMTVTLAGDSPGSLSASFPSRWIRTAFAGTLASAEPAPQTTGEKHKETGRNRQTSPGGSNHGPGDTLPPAPPGSGVTPPPAQPGPAGMNPTDPRSGGPSHGPGRDLLEQPGVRRDLSFDERWQVWWDRTRFAYLPFAPRHRAPGVANAPADGMLPPRELPRLRATALPVLRSLAHHPAATVRSEAVRALALLHDSQGLSFITEALADPVAAVADTALLSLGNCGQPEAVHALLHIARGSRHGHDLMSGHALPPYRQGLAALALALTGQPSATALLGQVALDRTATDEVRYYSAWSLGGCGDADAAISLLELARRPDEGTVLRSGAVLGLGQSGARETLPFGVSQLLEGRPPLAHSAALMLGLLASPLDTETVDLLGKAVLRSSDVDLRAFCTLALGLVGGPRAGVVLQRLLTRGRSQLTPWAAIAAGLHLRKSKDAALLRTLRRRMLGTMNANDRCALALSMGLSGMSDACQTLRAVLRSSASPTVAGYCALALGMIRQTADLEPISRRAERDHSPLFTYRAGMGVAVLDHPDSLGILLSWFQSETHPGVGRELALGLGLLGRVEAVSLLLDTLRDQTAGLAKLANAIRAVGLLLRVREQPADLLLPANTNDYDEVTSIPYVVSLLR